MVVRGLFLEKLSFHLSLSLQILNFKNEKSIGHKTSRNSHADRIGDF